ncbi:hypothetical protein FKW77_005280 [Venturia effusa]|uniref:Uncharacterized protein n=1 Tax=Venturia effusa TaxID=50376 RepID=A0A517L3A4_9PEZI|nr:hypothetical protein FKW77_005280 [Venturia effusa]
MPPRAQPSDQLADINRASYRTAGSKMPTSFTSLPLELRQKILLLSFDEPYDQDWAFSLNYISLRCCLVARSTKDYQVKVPFIHDWACVLKITHPDIEADLIWVLNKVLDTIEASFMAESARVFNRSKCLRWLRMSGVNNFSLACYGGEELFSVNPFWQVYDRFYDRKQELRASMTKSLGMDFD